MTLENTNKLINPFDNIEELKKLAPDIDWEKKKRDLIKHFGCKQKLKEKKNGR